LIVLKQLDKHMGKYPNPHDAVKAMRFTARMNFGRGEAIQRGEGVRRTRIVCHFPMHNTNDGDSFAVDLIDRDAIDPAMQAADRDECRRAVDQIPTVVATGIALTAVFGFDQGEAATQMGISRPYLSRTMKKSEREMRDGQRDAA
jgi:DNA-directed RNA polymerase specialized sigma24 family protein